jgi:predicted DNA-binding transcriptional regulator YafY
MSEMEELRWGNQRRFEFIEWKIYWTGRLIRLDLKDKFGISPGQASLDLREYQDVAPGNIEYDVREKAYVPTATFVPRYMRQSTAGDRYLRQVEAIQNGAILPSDTWFGSLLPMAVVPQTTRSVESETLRIVLRAIERRQEISITYQSLSSMKTRRVAPHALGYDGNRWHARAFCADVCEFRDFVLGRILDTPVDPTPADMDPNDDIEWNTLVPLELRAHPGLDAGQRAAIERDYEMADGCKTILIRAALAFYYIRHRNLDEALDGLPAQRRQICLANRDEVEERVQKSKDEASRRLAAKYQGAP